MSLFRAYLDRVQGKRRLRRALLTLWLPITAATLLPVFAAILNDVSISVVAMATTTVVGITIIVAVGAIAVATFEQKVSARYQQKLEEVALRLRQETIRRQAKTGYLAANLSAVELAVALDHVFSSPDDKMLWDGFDQAAPHDILQEWKNKSPEIKQSRATYFASALSEGLGKAIARDLAGGKGNIVCILRDNAFAAGISYEALNNAGAMNSRLIVILNDSDTEVAPRVSATSAYFARIFSDRAYLTIREAGQRVARYLPRSIATSIARIEEYSRGLLIGGTLFEELGFYYVGPIDGHNLDHLLPVLKNVRDSTKGPILVHVVTQIGKGYSELETSLRRDIQAQPTYSQVFAQSLIQEAHKDSRIIAVTAGMPTDTGVDRFSRVFPERAFNVGLAEQHAVAFCAGLAASGYKPFAIIYSTFLQRAYDQIVREVAVRKLPVRFAINGSSLNSERMEARTGIFDIANLSSLPNFVLMAPSDETELMNMTATQALIDDRPSAVRYPHDVCMGLPLPEAGIPVPIGKGRIIREGGKVALLSLGTRLRECERAADALARYGLPTTVADARFAAPLDSDLVVYLATRHQVLITVEEGSKGGFAASVMHVLAESGIFETRVRAIFVTEDFSTMAEQKDLLGAPAIVQKVLETLQLDNQWIGSQVNSPSDHRPDMKLPYASFTEGGTSPNLFWLKAHKPRR